MDRISKVEVQGDSKEEVNSNAAKKVLLIASVIFLLGLTGCKYLSSSDEKVLAQVGQEVLTTYDLKRKVPEGLNPNDSLQMVADYIKSWVKRQLLLQKAEANLSETQKDFEREVEEYRSSLIIYRYKNALVNQKLDTVVTQDQIKQYYNDFQQRFVLTQDIVKAIYIKIPVEMANQKKILSMCKQSDEDYSELETFAHRYAKKFDLFRHKWKMLNEVLQSTPFVIDNKQYLLKQGGNVDKTDGGYYYLLYIKEFRKKGDISPIEFVQDRIKSLILNKRKLSFFKNMENEIYKEGLKQSKFKIFN